MTGDTLVQAVGILASAIRALTVAAYVCAGALCIISGLRR